MRDSLLACKIPTFDEKNVRDAGHVNFNFSPHGGAFARCPQKALTRACRWRDISRCFITIQQQVRGGAQRFRIFPPRNAFARGHCQVSFGDCRRHACPPRLVLCRCFRTFEDSWRWHDCQPHNSHVGRKFPLVVGPACAGIQGRI